MSDQTNPAPESGSQFQLPMFPLGSTVFPGQIVPLHIFEERYRTLISDLVDGEASSEFGIALIERGHEVGGGDQRSAVATKVQILQSERFEDGRWGVITAGTQRLNVHEWLDDDPYPRAIVSERNVVDNGGDALDDVETLLEKTRAAVADHAGVEPPDDVEFSADPQQRLDQMSALAPLSEFDRQRILEAPTTREQIALLSQLLDDKLFLLIAQQEGPESSS